MWTFSQGESVPKSSCKIWRYFFSSAATSEDISKGWAAEASRSSAMRRSSSTMPFSRSTMMLLLMPSDVLQQSHQRGFQVPAIDDHVDRTLFQQKLRRLELIGQPLTNRLFDHPPSRKADHGFRFGHDDVGLKRERGRDPAGGRVGKHDHEEIAVFHEARNRSGGLRHLHEREHAFFHARAARSGEDHAR